MDKKVIELRISNIDKRVDYLCQKADRNYSKPEVRDDIQRDVDKLMDERDVLYKKLHSISESTEDKAKEVFPDKETTLDDFSKDAGKELDDMKKNLSSQKDSKAMTESERRDSLLLVEYTSRKEKKKMKSIKDAESDVQKYNNSLEYIKKQKDSLRKKLIDGTITKEAYDKNLEMIENSTKNISDGMAQSKQKINDLTKSKGKLFNLGLSNA